MSAPGRELRSALYEGEVIHRRAEPAHRFSNRVTLPLLFLDELPRLGSLHPLVDLRGDPPPHQRPAAMRLHREDFLPGPAPTLRDAIADAVRRGGGEARGPVAMLGHVRTWGWLFNPLSLYFCFDPGGERVEWTVLEVTNTPWHERRTYVVGPPGHHTFAKALHVSPFLPAEATYQLDYRAPVETVRVDLGVEVPTMPGAAQPAVRALSASLRLQRRPLDRAGLNRLLLARPGMTMRVSAGIYAQAARLALKGAPFHAHPRTGHTARGGAPACTCEAREEAALPGTGRG